MSKTTEADVVEAWREQQKAYHATATLLDRTLEQRTSLRVATPGPGELTLQGDHPRIVGGQLCRFGCARFGTLEIAACHEGHGFGEQLLEHSALGRR